MSENNEQFQNINIPDFEKMYKEEAGRLLKMVNDEMENHYRNSVMRNVDILSLYQVVKKIEDFESNIPGIDMLKKTLSQDMHTLCEHIERDHAEQRADWAKKIASLQDEKDKLLSQKKFFTMSLILFQWYLFPKYRNVCNELALIDMQIKQIEQETNCPLKEHLLIHSS